MTKTGLVNELTTGLHELSPNYISPSSSTCQQRCQFPLPSPLQYSDADPIHAISPFLSSLALGPPAGELVSFIEKQRTLQSKHNFSFCVCVGDFFGPVGDETEGENEEEDDEIVRKLLKGELDGLSFVPSYSVCSSQSTRRRVHTS